MPEKPYLFVSYAHADAGQSYGEFELERFLSDLEARGFRLWVDSEAIAGGTTWRGEIERGIDDAEAMLLIVTHQSALSNYVTRTEIPHAKKRGKSIIPVIIHTDALGRLGDIGETQGYTVSSDYTVALDKFERDLERWRSEKRIPLLELLDQETFISDNAAKLCGSTRFPERYRALALHHRRHKWRMSAALVVPTAARLQRPEQMQVFLQFSGEVESQTFREYLEYMQAARRSLWTI